MDEDKVGMEIGGIWLVLLGLLVATLTVFVAFMASGQWPASRGRRGPAGSGGSAGAAGAQGATGDSGDGSTGPTGGALPTIVVTVDGSVTYNVASPTTAMPPLNYLFKNTTPGTLTINMPLTPIMGQIWEFMFDETFTDVKIFRSTPCVVSGALASTQISEFSPNYISNAGISDPLQFVRIQNSAHARGTFIRFMFEGQTAGRDLFGIIGNTNFWYDSGE